MYSTESSCVILLRTIKLSMGGLRLSMRHAVS
jgi:hypothetical protein